MPTYRMDRKSQKAWDALYRPEFNALADYNSARLKGIAFEPDVIVRMAELQREFDENWRPKADEISRKARWRRCWLS